MINMYDKFLDKFMPSKDMREFLKTFDEIPFYKISDIIWYSNTKVQDKLEALKELEEGISQKQKFEDAYWFEELHKMITCIEYALEILENDLGVYTLEIGYYDKEIKNSDDEFEAVYSTFNDALEEANQITGWYKEDYDNMAWATISKWEKDKDGKMINRCEYIIIDTEIRYINISNPISDDWYSCDTMLCCGGDLSLPVPYEAGDIVEIDHRPFAPPFHAVVLTVGDNLDCCSFQALARDEDGLWSFGAVKHSNVGPVTCPSKDMLYTISHFNGELAEDEKLLLKLSESIKGNDDKAEELMYKMHRDCTDSELNEIIDSLGDKKIRSRFTSNMHDENCTCWICKAYPGKYNR